MLLSIRALLIAAGVVVLLLGGAAVEIYRVRQAAYQDHLAGLNALAAKDTTTHRLEGDVAVARRQAEQLVVALDNKAHEAHELGVALAKVKLTLDTIHRETHEDVTTIPDGYQLVSHLDTAGVHARAAATLFLSPAVHSTWDWTVTRDPLELAVDFSCRRDTALVHVTGPTWANADITKAVQSPNICNPPPRFHLLEWKLPSLPVGVGIFTLGYLVRTLVAH